MLKRIFELFGLVTMGIGVYFIVYEHPKQGACNATEGKYIGFGMSAPCQHVVYAYFGGFILLAAGTLVVVFGLLATRRSQHMRLSKRRPSLASQYNPADPKNGRVPHA
jgi:hypothetical protein